jgi:hypothetical protein
MVNFLHGVIIFLTDLKYKCWIRIWIQSRILILKIIKFLVVREEWLRAGHKIKYSRYNHATITVPGDMFPQCLTTT